MIRRFIIRDIITKKHYRLNNRWINFSSYCAARSFLLWMPFGLGNYYEIFDDKEQKVIDSENRKKIKYRKKPILYKPFADLRNI